MTLTRLATAVLATALFAGVASAQSAAESDEVRQVCAADFQKVCPDAKPGHGALKACAKAHFMSFSTPCRHELRAMRARMRHSAQTSAADSE